MKGLIKLGINIGSAIFKSKSNTINTNTPSFSLDSYRQIRDKVSREAITTGEKLFDAAERILTKGELSIFNRGKRYEGMTGQTI